MIANRAARLLPAAAAFLHTLLDRFLKDVGYPLHLAELHYRLGNFESARIALNRAARLKPRHPRVIELLLNACFRDRDIDGARRLLNDTRNTPLRRRQRLRNRAANEARAGNLAEAATFYRRLVESHSASYLDEIGLAICEARLGNHVEAAALTRRAARRAGAAGTNHALAAHIISRAAADAGLRREFAAMKQSVLAAAPGPAVLSGLERARSTLLDIRARATASARNTKATLLCPIHRPEDVENAVAQISAQSWPNAEAVFAVNSHAIAESRLRALWASSMPLKVVDCTAFTQLGAILNHAVASCGGDVILKIDADCIYMPRYCEDMVLSLLHFNAGLVSKKCMFRYFEEFDFLDLELREFCYRRADVGVSSGGTALCIDRRLFRDMRFQTIHQVGEDTAFTLEAVARGHRHVFVDPFNHYAMKATDPARHTWHYDGAFLSLRKPRVLVGDRSAIGRYVSA